jgi:hypothetical protein
MFPFVWIFLATIQIKEIGIETYLPFFKILIFAMLPIVLINVFPKYLYIINYSQRQWLILASVAYLYLYPFVSIFILLEERILKDAAYTSSIYVILIFFVHQYFSDVQGSIDCQKLGRFIVLFAIVESILALALKFGLEIDFVNGTKFMQTHHSDRIHGVLGTPTHLAPIVAVAYLYILSQSIKFTNLLLATFLLIVLFMTGSRSALLGVLLSTIIYIFYKIQIGRYSISAIYKILAIIMITFGFMMIFIEYTDPIIQTATRVESMTHEKSRFVMWEKRLTEFIDYDIFSQLFGKGHRKVGQTFNVNVEYLVSYGIIYFLIFNIFYMLILLKFYLKALRYRDSSDLFILLIAIFIYVFSQGINFISYEFVHFIQLFIVVILFNLVYSYKRTI